LLVRRVKKANIEWQYRNQTSVLGSPHPQSLACKLNLVPSTQRYNENFPPWLAQLNQILTNRKINWFTTSHNCHHIEDLILGVIVKTTVFHFL